MKKLVLTTIALFIALMASAADYDFTYELYNGVKIYCKITKAATSTKTEGYGEVSVVGGTGPEGSELDIDLVKYNDYYYKPTAIRAQAFDGATWIKNLHLSIYTTNVGQYAFRNCTNLTYIDIRQRTALGKGQFYGCTALTSVVIPSGVTAIPEECFFKCSNLANLTLGPDVTTIGDMAFSYCSKLSSLDLAPNVTTVGDNAFCYCDNLTSVNLAPNVTTVGNYAFYQCTNLETLTIGSKVTTIGDYAFYQCKSLDNLVVPETVTSLGKKCFSYSGTGRGTINIGCNVENSAFLNMNYNYVYLLETIKKFDINSFSDYMTELYI